MGQRIREATVGQPGGIVRIGLAHSLPRPKHGFAYGSTFEAALAALFGGASSSLTPVAEPQRSVPQSTATAAQPTANLNPTISEAAKDLADYQRLTAEGKLGEAGQKLEELKRAIDKLNTHP